MILTTTNTIEGHPVKEYKGIVTGETIIGANALKDFMAGLTDFLEGDLRLMKSSYRRKRYSFKRITGARCTNGC